MGRPQGLGGRRTIAAQQRVVRTAATGAAGERAEYRKRALCGAVARRGSGRIAGGRIIEAVR